MNNSDREEMLDLLVIKATSGLSREEAERLKQLEEAFPELKEDKAFDFAAAAVNLINLKIDEPLPERLHSRILADADKYFEFNESSKQENSPAEEEYQKTFVLEQKTSIWNSLGWLVAAAACIALAIVLWQTRTDSARVEYVQDQSQTKPAPTPSLAEQRQQLIATASDVVVEDWTDFDPKKPRNVRGDVVWSNSAQKGFIRFRNLPVNDKTKEAYQLWIFDETQRNPIDGGVFDAGEASEIIVPIDAKLEVKKPTMFAITAEKPGGVVVSELGKVMAVAKIET